MGILSKCGDPLGRTRSSSFYCEFKEAKYEWLEDDGRDDHRCLECWDRTKWAVYYNGNIIHHYCLRCQRIHSVDIPTAKHMLGRIVYGNTHNPVNRMPEGHGRTVVKHMHELFREMAVLRSKKGIKTEPLVGIVEGNVAVGKSTLLEKWRTEYLGEDALFITENIASWTKYPLNKMTPHVDELRSRGHEETVNLLALDSPFLRQLYILRQIIEEFNAKMSSKVRIMMIERGIIGSINIAKSSPGITVHQMAILETYVKLFQYDNFRLCMYVGLPNSCYHSAIKNDENRILINEIRTMNADLVEDGIPDVYITMPNTPFDVVDDAVTNSKPRKTLMICY